MMLLLHGVLCGPIRIFKGDYRKVEKPRKPILRNAADRSTLEISIPESSFNFGNLLNANIFKDSAFNLQKLKHGGLSLFLEELQNIYSQNPKVSKKDNPEKMYQSLINSYILDLESMIQKDPLSLQTDGFVNVALEALKHFLTDDAIRILQLLVLKQKIQTISKDNVKTFPIQLGFGAEELVLNKVLGMGRYGIAYDAYLKNDINKEPLVVKVYHGQEDLINIRREKRVLDMLGRLVHYNEEFGMLVYKQVQGESLLDVIIDNNSQEMHKDQYRKLSRNFYRETGWIHGDIRPPNVIVDSETGALKLIDFGRAFKPDGNEETLEEALTIDEEYSEAEYNHCILYSKMLEGYKAPNEDSSMEKIERYIDSLIKNKEGRGDEIAPAVRKYFHHLCKLRMLDRFKYDNYNDY